MTSGGDIDDERRDEKILVLSGYRPPSACTKDSSPPRAKIYFKLAARVSALEQLPTL